MSLPVHTGTAAPETRAVELAIGDMTCAACAARVERKLNKIDGVRATVNFATEKASVHAPESVSVDDLIAEVVRAGYRADTVEPERPAQPEPDQARLRDLFRRLVVAVLLGAPLGDLSITFALVPSLRFTGWQWVLVALTLPVAVWAAWPFHRTALSGARHGASSMDTLVSTGITAACVWSIYTIFAHGGVGARGDGVWGLIFQPGGAIYLDVASGVTIFLLAGRLFEAKAKQRAGGALRALAALGAKDATVLRDGVEYWIPVAELRVGDEFVVRPGETIATDGEVISGASGIDSSTMTGEATPAEVTEGGMVTGGTVALWGRLVVRATRVGKDTQLAQLTRLVEEAQTDKARVQRLADRICGVFVPAVFSVAALTFLGWWLLAGSVDQGISSALAVLIIACPCALGLATPTALMVASGRGAQLGIFLKGHHALESARAIDTVVLDKTGTVTAGRMAVVGVHVTGDTDRAALLRLAGAVENASEHVVARAVTALARTEIGALPPVEDFTALAGLGARGRVDGEEVLVGSARLLSERDITVPETVRGQREAWERDGRTTVVVAVGGVVCGAFALADTVKPSAPAAIRELLDLGLRVVLLTGDNAVTARAVAAQVGIDEVIAEVLPRHKAATIEKLQADGRSVAMVGDGVNDAPALARADLGMAVIAGTDVALGAADIILVRDDLTAVPCGVRLARATLRTLRGNLAWAFGYNLAAVPLAALGLLNPLIAGGAMAVSSLFVVSNSLRLRRFDHVAEPTAVGERPSGSSPGGEEHEASRCEPSVAGVGGGDVEMPGEGGAEAGRGSETAL
jgi:cation-transporting P-type ATPase A/B/Cu+-exporting ATPase